MQEHKNGKENTDPVSEDEPRKIRILIMGNSVTAGGFCQNNPELGKISGMERNACSWGTRLHQMLEGQFPGAVQLDVAAFGERNTRGGTKMWEYDLFNDDVPNPDIVINTFSTNNMHAMSVKDAEIKTMTLEDAIIDMNQEFIRKVLKP